MRDAPQITTSFDELINDARRAMKDCHEGFAEFKGSLRGLWTKWAGPRSSEMLQSQSTAERYLTHEHKFVRLAALSILAFHWKATTLAAKFEELALNDPDNEVRGAAVVVLGSAYAATNDTRIQKLLAAMVREEKQTPERRRTAYASLFTIRGLPVISSPTLRSEFRFPQDVDWELVASAEGKSRE